MSTVSVFKCDGCGKHIVQADNEFGIAEKIGLVAEQAMALDS